MRGRFVAIEARGRCVHIEQSVMVEPNRVEPDRWRPLIMSFQHFYGLQDGKCSTSALAQIPEHQYRRPDMVG